MYMSAMNDFGKNIAGCKIIFQEKVDRQRFSIENLERSCECFVFATFVKNYKR